MDQREEGAPPAGFAEDVREVEGADTPALGVEQELDIGMLFHDARHILGTNAPVNVTVPRKVGGSVVCGGGHMYSTGRPGNQNGNSGANIASGGTMPKTVEKMESKSLNSPEEVRKFDKGKVELVNVAGATIGRATFEPGWKWSTCVKPIAKTNSCQAVHFGYQVSGTMTTRMDDGTEKTSKAGDVLNIPPGHDAWVVGNEAVVILDFQGMVDYAKQRK